jgi:RNA polymerase primary sigma factor
LRHSFTQALWDALDGLPEREKQVLAQRYGLGDDQPHTLREIGASMGLSRERVRQIEATALKKIQQAEEQGTLREFLA